MARIYRMLSIRSTLKRGLHTPPSPPHAYLRPLLSTAADGAHEELDGVMCLTMDRKETRNALSVRMVGEMRESIARLGSTSSARILLLHSSTPGLFCSGADLHERRSMSAYDVSQFLDFFRGLLEEMETIDVPSVAVVDGYALGGGAELALACDLRVGGENTKIALPEAKLGIIPGAGGTQRLSHLIGVARAKELIFTGRRVDGVEAERMGLINAYAPPPTSPMTAALHLSRQILTSAPLSLSAAKQAISAAPFLPLERGLDLERGLYNGLLDTDDREEGLRAFAEKRKAVFKGK